MGKNYQCHQIGIPEIVQLNSNKHGFKSSHSLLFYKQVFLKSWRIHMKTPVPLIRRKSIAGAFL